MFDMFKQEEIIKILKEAAAIDFNCDLFGAEKHRYMLNPPIDASAVRNVEKKYGFTLPNDYFRFITEIGDGGAGLDYGIYPFIDFLRTGRDEYAEKYIQAYRRGVAKPFTPRPMNTDEVANYGFAKEAYERNPNKFFIFEEYCEDDGEHVACLDGFFVIGTHGCQWDFGIIVAGERRGQVFDTDNEGAYSFVANSFNEFYQQWLDRISDVEAFKRELEARRKLFEKHKKMFAISSYCDSTCR